MAEKILAYQVSEAEVQRQIIDYLLLHNWLILRINGGGVRSGKRYIRFAYWEAKGIADEDKGRGIADIIACSPEGEFAAFEVKKQDKKSKPTKYQKQFVKEVGDRFAISAVVRSVEDVEKAISRSRQKKGIKPDDLINLGIMPYNELGDGSNLYRKTGVNEFGEEIGVEVMFINDNPFVLFYVDEIKSGKNCVPFKNIRTVEQLRIVVKSYDL